MKSFPALLLTIFLSLFCVNLPAQDSQSMQMAGKNYAADSTERNLQADYAALNLRTYSYSPYSDEEMNEIIRELFELLKKARKAGIPQLELQIRHDIIHFYWNRILNFELALEQCDLQEQRLSEISSGDIPEKPMYYGQIGSIHYHFKDYAKARFYYEKALSDTENIHNQGYRQGPLNNLGLCYRDGLHDLDRSDSCFYAILHVRWLKPADELKRDNWDGIAEGSIGHNMYLRGEYDKAIPLLNSSIEKVLKYDDYGFASGAAIHLADIYLKKGKLAQAKSYIDSALCYYAKFPRESNLPFIYETMSKYYAATGDTKLCTVYIDSTQAAKKRYEERFNAFQLMRVEQRKHLSEQKIKDEQLQTEKIRNTGYRRSLLIALIGVVLLAGGLLRYQALYRKKKEAYRELVRKSQEWAQIPVTDRTQTAGSPETAQAPPVSELDRKLFEQLQQLLQSDHLYRDDTITIEKVARRMKVNKNNLSRIVNGCAGKNFNVYINEYRIQEAVRLMSANPDKFSLEGLGFEVGFSERRSFYNAFRKITGLSPSEFRRNLSDS